MIATYPTLEAFYECPILGAERKWSLERDFGVWWRERSIDWPRHRVSWVEKTGEVYAFRQAHVREADDVVVLGVVHGVERVEEVLDGWVDHCGPPDGLQWVHARMVDARATEALS